MIIQGSLFVLFLILVVPTAFADNTLQNMNLIGESATVSLDIEFGEDTVKSGFDRDYIRNNLDAITLTFYGDKIPLSEPEIKITSTGNHFRIHSVPEGVLIYGHKNPDLDNYNINVYFATDKGFNKFSVTSTIPKENVVEVVEEIVDTGTEIHFLVDQYERVFNQSNYKFFVKTFDKSLYSGDSWDKFEGVISGAKVTAIISDPDGVIKSDTTGIVEYGTYEGTIYVPYNLWQKGWYTVDLQIEFEGKLYYEELTFYVYGMTVPSDSPKPVVP